MECDNYQEQMSVWIDKRLSQDEMRQLEAHTATCQSCRTALEGLRRVDRLLNSAPMVTPVPGFTKRFQARLAARRRRRRTWAGLLTLTLGASALLFGPLLLLGIWGLVFWEGLPVSGLLVQIISLSLDLGEVVAASFKLGWLIISALVKALQHPVFIAYFAATAILIAAWTEIVTRRSLARRPISI